MFLFKYSQPSEEWKQKEKEFGKDVWSQMQEKIMEKFREQYPQRHYIEDGVRIR